MSKQKTTQPNVGIPFTKPSILDRLDDLEGKLEAALTLIIGKDPFGPPEPAPKAKRGPKSKAKKGRKSMTEAQRLEHGKKVRAGLRRAKLGKSKPKATKKVGSNVK